MSLETECAYLASPDFIAELVHELSDVRLVLDRLVIAKGPRQTSVWAQMIAEDIQTVNFKSIGEAAKILRAQNRNWASYSTSHHRRAELIQEQLPSYKSSPLQFLQPLPTLPMGFWSLLGPEQMLMSARTSTPLPLGEVSFAEDKTTPPSRAYLKLWELFTLYGIRPRAGEKVIDFGSCPGGWTWVLQQMGCHVLSIDKAPLAPQIQSLPRVEFLKADAFSLKPEKLGPIDWFFSDIICYPPKLFDLIEEWRDKKLCSRFVCTIKFQGETDFETIRRFRQKLSADVHHLFHNKHEVTAIILPST